MGRTTTAEDRKGARLRSKYGITIQQRNALFQLQGECCAVCGTKDPPKRFGSSDGWVIDHDHSYERQTGLIRIRGVLCANCNNLLGFAQDSVDTLQAAIEYLKKNKL
jgi:hypothetical protein